MEVCRVVQSIADAWWIQHNFTVFVIIELYNVLMDMNGWIRTLQERFAINLICVCLKKLCYALYLFVGIQYGMLVDIYVQLIFQTVQLNKLLLRQKYE